MTTWRCTQAEESSIVVSEHRHLRHPKSKLESHFSAKKSSQNRYHPPHAVSQILHPRCTYGHHGQQKRANRGPSPRRGESRLGSSGNQGQTAHRCRARAAVCRAVEERVPLSKVNRQLHAALPRQHECSTSQNLIPVISYHGSKICFARNQ
jgi:hypothetical protein